MVNVDLLERTMSFIEQHPDAHTQGLWTWVVDDRVSVGNDPEKLAECGTAACFAGWAALLSGRVTQVHGGGLVIVSGQADWVWNVATDALGLGDGTAEILFHTENTIGDLRRMVEKVKADDYLSDDDLFDRPLDDD